MKITIECDKDIESLSINFADGSSSKSKIVYRDPEPAGANTSNASNSKPQKKSSREEKPLDFDDYAKEASSTVSKIEKPSIDISNREVSVVKTISEESF